MSYQPLSRKPINWGIFFSSRAKCIYATQKLYNLNIFFFHFEEQKTVFSRFKWLDLDGDLELIIEQDRVTTVAGRNSWLVGDESWYIRKYLNREEYDDTSVQYCISHDYISLVVNTSVTQKWKRYKNKRLENLHMIHLFRVHYFLCHEHLN